MVWRGGYVAALLTIASRDGLRRICADCRKRDVECSHRARRMIFTGISQQFYLALPQKSPYALFMQLWL
jgi:hypothetical protein